MRSPFATIVLAFGVSERRPGSVWSRRRAVAPWMSLITSTAATGCASAASAASGFTIATSSIIQDPAPASAANANSRVMDLAPAGTVNGRRGCADSWSFVVHSFSATR